VSVRTLGPPLHPLVDDPRPGTPPTPLGTAAESPTPALVEPGAGPAVTSRDAIKARAADVLAARCAACHGAPTPAAGLRADTPDALREVQAGVRWVTPGRPDESRLFDVVGVRSAAGRIAPKHCLSASEMDVLRAWITSLYE
jgi:mono/diheme cytochrome c family protein